MDAQAWRAGLGRRFPGRRRSQLDADYATQRDVSRTKRDIKTFEIRLRIDNQDRVLALGMTAYVTVPLPKSVTHSSELSWVTMPWEGRIPTW